MGTWGYKINQNDIYSDVKQYYISYLQLGKSNIEATKMLMDKFHCILVNEDDAPLFWMALAQIQWQKGRLLDEVKHRAIVHIEKGADLEFWYERSQQLGDKRKKALNDLKEQLDSQPPQRKKTQKKNFYRCPWKIGDAFAYKITNELATENSLQNKYIIFQKSMELYFEDKIFRDGDKVPLIRFWISDKCDFKYTIRYFPCEPEQPLPLKSGNYHYLKQIYSTSTRSIPKCLMMLGNYEVFVPNDDSGYIEKIDKYNWWNWNEFEKQVINHYCKNREIGKFKY